MRKYSVWIGGSILRCHPRPSVCTRLSSSSSSASSASAPKRIRSPAANWSRAGFEAAPVMNSHCFTWQNASLKEPDEGNDQNPWRMPSRVESEPVPTPVSVGPIALWRAAITKYNFFLIEFDHDREELDHHATKQAYSVTRMVLLHRPQSVKFMLIVTEPPNVPTREIIKISREFTEVTAVSYGARAPIELVRRAGCLKHVKSNPTRPPPPVLPAPRRVNRTLVVETDESGKEVNANNAHDEVIVIAENQKNEASSSSSVNKVDVVDKNETSNVKVDEVVSNQCDETSGVSSNVIPERKRRSSSGM